MTTIILSLNPEWWPLILLGKKELEIRKTAPQGVYYPLRVIVYLTAPISMVAGEFICKDVLRSYDYEMLSKRSCVPEEKLFAYMGSRALCGWEITRPMEYPAKRSVTEYRMKRPPQSWCYLKRGEDYER